MNKAGKKYFNDVFSIHIFGVVAVAKVIHISNYTDHTGEYDTQ